MENADVARVVSEIADILELTSGSPFKVRAYRQAAQVVDAHPRSVAELRRQGRLRPPRARGGAALKAVRPAARVRQGGSP